MPFLINHFWSFYRVGYLPSSQDTPTALSVYECGGKGVIFFTTVTLFFQFIDFDLEQEMLVEIPPQVQSASVALLKPPIKLSHPCAGLTGEVSFVESVLPLTSLLECVTSKRSLA